MNKREWILAAVAFGIGVVVIFGPAFGLGALLAGKEEAGAGENTGASSEQATPPEPTPDLGPDPDTTASALPTPEAPATATEAEGGALPSGAAAVQCPAVTVSVSSAEELQGALADAEPGDVIGLQDGVYEGEFATTASGTADLPIWLCGSQQAVLDGDGHDAGYVFHLDGAKNWRLIGFTVRNGQKGVMADGTTGTVISGLTINSIGDEALHLRRFSTDNLVTGNTIFDTGNRREKFGEGIYIGTAESNWCDITDCQPDNSDRNVISDNTIYDVTAEAVDIKEGTSSGVLRGNRFDGAGMKDAGADSWVDVKGNDWLIESNSGVNSTLDGFQVHEILDGWGRGNRFVSNSAVVNGKGFGFSLTPAQDNVVECSNAVQGAGEGYSNVSCT